MNYIKLFKAAFIKAILLFLVIFLSCKDEKVKKEYKPTNAHELYIYSLEKAKLNKSVLYSQFVNNSQAALLNALKVPIPYSEIFYIDHSNPEAFGYRFELQRGQRLKVKVDLHSKDSVQLFVDVFRIKDTANTNWYRAASASIDSMQVQFVARRKAEYILRIQPELLCDVQCNVSIEVESSLKFPVIGKNKNAIHSFFGDPRDGGRRDHHGVDIFAPRHTDIIASADGYVGRTGNRGIGGKHVWVYYPFVSAHCYYAHLETIEVKNGMKIKAGTKIGTVGNTGNARHTPPHLHFGIYFSGLGPIDPYFFIATDNKKTHRISNFQHLLNQPAKINSVANIEFSNETIEFPKNTGFNVMAVNTTKAKIKLPDGRIGFIDINKVEECKSQRKFTINSQNTTLYNAPKSDALVVAELSNESIEVLFSFNNYYKVKLENNVIGWINLEEFI